MNPATREEDTETEKGFSASSAASGAKPFVDATGSLAIPARFGVAAPPLRHILVPSEHGSWGFLLEPAAVGILVAPSIAGGLLVLGALGFFLARHPVRLGIQDLSRRRLYPRTHLALRFGATFALIGAAAMMAAATITGPRALIPLACAMPLLLVQIGFDLRGGSRTLSAEIAGASAAGSLAAACGIAGGLDTGPAFVLWLLMLGRAVPSILYVRARIRIARGDAANRLPALASATAAFLTPVFLLTRGDGSQLAVLAFCLLLARAVIGLRVPGRAVRIQTIGFGEFVWGLLTVVFLAFGVPGPS